MENTSICNKCQKKASQKCGGCHSVFYCSKEHQKLDWKQHKKYCQPFKVSLDTRIGRYLIATRDVKPNEIILKERPLIYGPSQETIPVCLGCGQEITVKNYRPCTKCGWPMCSQECERNPCHTPECEYTCTRGEKVNAHEVPLSEPSYIAIYEKSSMFESDCGANCNKSFTSQGEIIFVSGPSIRKGDHLSTCYADPLWGTISRRQFLHETKYFWCTCKRCSDPTEFGTYFSSIRCQSDGTCNGLLLPTSFLGLEDEKQNWHCNKCSRFEPHALVTALLEKIETDLAHIDKDDVAVCKKFIGTYETILGSNNYHIVDVKLTLGQLIGQELPKGMSGISDDDLELKRKLCLELIHLIKTLIPCEKRVSGLLLFELHASLAELGRRKSLKVSKAEGVSLALKESRTHLMECIELLKHEPDVLPEGKIYQQALKNLHDLNRLL